MLPMNDSTLSNDKTSKFAPIAERLARPSKDALMFVRMFARMYEPVMAVAV